MTSLRSGRTRRQNPNSYQSRRGNRSIGGSSSNHNNNKTIDAAASPRRSRRGLVIGLESAKELVEKLCLAAVHEFSLTMMGSDPNPINKSQSRSGSHGDPHQAEAEAEFSTFVSDTLARTVESIAQTVALANIQPKDPLLLPATTPDRPTRPRGRPRKRQRLPSKVEGLERAESLHTMCSLFPMVLGTATSEAVVTPLPLPALDEGPATAAAGDDENDSVNQVLDGIESVQSITHQSHHSSSDHDSLLPPVGDESGNPEADETEEEIAEENHHHGDTTKDEHKGASIRTPPTLASPSSATLMALTANHDEDAYQYDDDDDENDHPLPLIGVLGDDGGNSSSSNCSTPEDIIRLKRVGSIIPLKIPQPS